MEVIPGGFKHSALVVAVIDKKEMGNVVIKTCIKRGRIGLLKDGKIWK